MKKMNWKRLISLGLLSGYFLFLPSVIQAEEAESENTTIQSEEVSSTLITTSQEVGKTGTMVTTDETTSLPSSTVEEKKILVS
ncbi:hypothetical protein [Vagococcus sp.]|uniref:hypothetical protein n=1 Tax=Vagococcus sp. TaxID=1933889 RepID=UPI003F9CA01D